MAESGERNSSTCSRTCTPEDNRLKQSTTRQLLMNIETQLKKGSHLYSKNVEQMNLNMMTCLAIKQMEFETSAYVFFLSEKCLCSCSSFQGLMIWCFQHYFRHQQAFNVQKLMFVIKYFCHASLVIMNDSTWIELKVTSELSFHCLFLKLHGMGFSSQP